MDKWRRLINGSIRVYMESVEKWPLGQKFLLCRPNSAKPSLVATTWGESSPLKG